MKIYWRNKACSAMQKQTRHFGSYNYGIYGKHLISLWCESTYFIKNELVKDPAIQLYDSNNVFGEVPKVVFPIKILPATTAQTRCSAEQSYIWRILPDGKRHSYEFLRFPFNFNRGLRLHICFCHNVAF